MVRHAHNLARQLNALDLKDTIDSAKENGKAIQAELITKRVQMRHLQAAWLQPPHMPTEVMAGSVTHDHAS